MTANGDRPTARLSRGRIVEASVARFAVNTLLPPEPGQPVTGANLLIVTDEETEIDVATGETFPVADQVWRLDEVRLIGDDDYEVVISRVSPA